MPVTFRPGTAADSRACFDVFCGSLADLMRRTGYPYADEQADSFRQWDDYASLYDFLAQLTDHWWVAEQDGKVEGYARSITVGGGRELTEFFVMPSIQSGGVGRELLRRAFPADTLHRTIIATYASPAQALYVKVGGVYPFTPCYELGIENPTERRVETDLEFAPMSPADLPAIAAIDREILGFDRDVIHQWLMTNRQGYLYRRDGQAVGYGYEAKRSGPFALLDPADIPAALAHAEADAARRQQPLWFVAPGLNHTAFDTLLGWGYQIDSFQVVLMSTAPFGKLDRYIIVVPEFFL
jgi:GNAT superfamily N-acetyltransferase